MKFYDEMLAALRGFFGKAEATEAELHQSIVDAETVESLAVKANAAAAESVRADMDALKTSFADLKTQFEAVQAADTQKAEMITQLQDGIESLKTSLTEKDATIAQQAEQIKTLSGELADYKVGKPTSQAAPPADPSIPVPANAEGAGKARVITNEQFAALFN